MLFFRLWVLGCLFGRVEGLSYLDFIIKKNFNML